MYFTNRKFVKNHKDAFMKLGIDYCKVIDWDWWTGKIKVRVYDEIRNITYLSLKNCSEISNLK